MHALDAVVSVGLGLALQRDADQRRSERRATSALRRGVLLVPDSHHLRTRRGILRHPSPSGCLTCALVATAPSCRGVRGSARPAEGSVALQRVYFRLRNHHGRLVRWVRWTREWGAPFRACAYTMRDAGIRSDLPVRPYGGEHGIRPLTYIYMYSWMQSMCQAPLTRGPAKDLQHKHPYPTVLPYRNMRSAGDM